METSIGTLKFFDGVPTRETVEMVYDILDRMRGVEAFPDALPETEALLVIIPLPLVSVIVKNLINELDQID